MINNTPMLSPEEVAKKLNVSRATVYRWTAIGLIPAPFRRGRTIRFHPERIENFITPVSDVEETKPGK